MKNKPWQYYNFDFELILSIDKNYALLIMNMIQLKKISKLILTGGFAKKVNLCKFYN